MTPEKIHAIKMEVHEDGYIELWLFEAIGEIERLRGRVSELEDFTQEIRDGYDCDTGANGVHAYRCRCCVAGDLLGQPPRVFDQRTRGG